MRDQLIRDLIVVGIRDDKLSEKMQLDPDLTLEKAISLARQSEAVKKQQPLIRGQIEPEGNLGAVKSRGMKYPSNFSLTTLNFFLLSSDNWKEENISSASLPIQYIKVFTWIVPSLSMSPLALFQNMVASVNLLRFALTKSRLN
jgi:hypothetical protein